MLAAVTALLACSDTVVQTSSGGGSSTGPVIGFAEDGASPCEGGGTPGPSGQSLSVVVTNRSLSCSAVGVISCGYFLDPPPEDCNRDWHMRVNVNYAPGSYPISGGVFRFGNESDETYCDSHSDQSGTLTIHSIGAASVDAEISGVTIVDANGPLTLTVCD
jgi:hypothetical protein